MVKSGSANDVDVSLDMFDTFSFIILCTQVLEEKHAGVLDRLDSVEKVGRGQNTARNTWKLEDGGCLLRLQRLGDPPTNSPF